MIARYFGLLAPYRGRLALAVTLLLVGGALPVAAILSVRAALESERPGLWLAAFVACGWLYVGLGVARTAITRRIAVQLSSAMRARVLQRTWAMPAKQEQGATSSAALEDAEDLAYGISALVTAIRNPVTVLGLLAGACWISPLVTTGLLLALLPWAAVVAFGGRGVKKWSEESRRQRGALIDLVHEQVAGARVIAAFGVAAFELERLNEQDRADAEARWKWEVGRTLPGAAAEAMGAVTAAAAGAFLLLQASLTASDRLTILLCVIGLARPMSGLAEAWSLAQRALVALERLTPWWEGGTPARQPSLLSGDLVWREVSVTRDAFRMEGVSLSIPRGEWCVWLGANGAGKSTLMHTALGWVDAKGSVTLANVALESLTPSERTCQFAWVPQEPMFFGRTVRENLCLGREIREDLLKEALDAVGLQLELDRPLSEYGRSLSGGELQKLSIARAWVSPAKVWLLDEPTTALDPEAERGFLEAVGRLRGDRTVVFISHRTTVLEYADREVRFEAGRVVGDRRLC